MRLTQALCKYIPDYYHMRTHNGAFFKKQKLFYMTRYYRNIGWSTHKNAMNRFQYYLKGEMYFSKLTRERKRDVNRSRIAAACDEHGYTYSHLVSTLPKLDVHLDLKSLAHLAIYEPRTFESLIECSREAAGEDLPPANFDPARL